MAGLHIFCLAYLPKLFYICNRAVYQIRQFEIIPTTENILMVMCKWNGKVQMGWQVEQFKVDTWRGGTFTQKVDYKRGLDMILFRTKIVHWRVYLLNNYDHWQGMFLLKYISYIICIFQMTSHKGCKRVLQRVYFIKNNPTEDMISCQLVQQRVS